MLLRKKAAEELKKEQERKAAERRRIIEERCGQPKNLDDANEGKLARLAIVFFLSLESNPSQLIRINHILMMMLFMHHHIACYICVV